MDNAKVVSTLNNLIETCKDGQQGFKDASEGINDPSLKTLFSEYSLQRSRFAGELQAQVQTLGETPDQKGSVAGAIHRGWINIKSAVTGKDEAAIIAECERGEDVATHSYQKALETDLPMNIRTLVEQQSLDVKAAHDRIRSLEKATSHS